MYVRIYGCMSETRSETVTEAKDGDELPFPLAAANPFLKLCMKNMERHLARDRFLQL